MPPLESYYIDHLCLSITADSIVSSQINRITITRIGFYPQRQAYLAPY